MSIGVHEPPEPLPLPAKSLPTPPATPLNCTSLGRRRTPAPAPTRSGLTLHPPDDPPNDPPRPPQPHATTRPDPANRSPHDRRTRADPPARLPRRNQRLQTG